MPERVTARVGVPAIEIFTDQWPAVFCKIDGEQTLADFEGYIAAFERMYERSERFAVITYLKHYTVKADIIARVGRWFRETEPLFHKYLSSNAMVSPSSGFRFVLSSVYLIKPLPVPSIVCATPEEAVSFTRTHWRSPGSLGPMRWPF
jgi:hypothetical protein